MGGHDDPRAALANSAEVFGDGLQGQHQLGVGADELADLIREEQDAVLGRLGVEILFDPMAKVFDRDAEGLFGILEPLMRRLGGKVENAGQRLLDVVLVELIAVALIEPVQPG